MTFTAYHQSNAQSAPILLLLLTWGNTQWAYCSGDRQVTHDSVTYDPIAMEEERLDYGGRDAPEYIVSVPRSLPVAAKFQGTPPSTRVNLVVRFLEADDPDAESVIRWIGPITNVRLLDPVKAQIVSRISTLKRSGGRDTYARGCKYALYGPGCGVTKATYATARTVSAVDGNLITLNADTPSDGYFNGGLIEWDADGLGTIESRTIALETAANQIILLGRGDGISVSQSVTLYPGCARDADTCDDKFDNLANYPGYDFMIGETPFEGRSLV